MSDLERLLGHPPRPRRRTPRRATANPGRSERRPVAGGMPGDRWREQRGVHPVTRTPETGPGASGPRPAGRWSNRVYRGLRRGSLARRARGRWSRAERVLGGGD